MIAGRYRVIGLLGRSGTGEVYRADDVKLGQTVALKFLPREMSADAANIMIDGDGRVRILDFGLAVGLASEPLAGEIIGTPAYMANASVGYATLAIAIGLAALGFHSAVVGRRQK